MTHHTVAANLVMSIFLIGGLVILTNIKQEVFPEFKVDQIRVSVPYPGASPEEVEQGIILSIEDVVRGLDGVKKVTATASEGRAKVEIELLDGVNADNVLQDVVNEIDGIQSFPELAEEPIISLAEVRNQVVTVLVYGDQEEQTLRDVAERVRDDLLQRPGITLVELGLARPREIAIEVPQRHLRAYGLTLNRIAREVGEAAIELPGGGVKTPGGEVLLRTQERRDFGREYEDIPVASTPDGATITVGDIATIRDGFEDVDQEAYFNGQRAIQVKVFRVGLETPQSVSESVRAYLEELRPELPDGIGFAMWNDRSEIYEDRMNLLLKNAFLGLALVLLLLGLFLDLKLAFWVTVGLPVSIIGSFLFIPFTGASINMISLFAFIITLGIIVDDAVVAGEIIYQKREQGLPLVQAAIAGAREIAGPIMFAVLTNIAAFLPLFFVPGALGNFLKQVPAVVVAVFVVSLIESLFVLPAHLAHTRELSGFWKTLDRPRQWFAQAMKTFIRERYQPFLRSAIANRWLTLAVGVALLILAVGIVAGGHIPFSFLPAIDSEIITAQATLPYGAPMEQSRRVLHRLEESAKVAIAELGGEAALRGIYAQIGAALMQRGPRQADSGAMGSHTIGVQVFLKPADQRDFSGADFARVWRASIGTIPGLESLGFKAEVGPTGGLPIDIQLAHRSRTILETAAQGIPVELNAGDGVIYSNFLLHTGSNYTTKKRRTLHGGHAIFGQYPEMGFADSLAPSAREKFESFARRGEEMKDATEAALRAVISRDAAGYRAALESLQPGAGPHGRTVLTIYLSKAALHIWALKDPGFDATEESRLRASSYHEITLNWGPEFADRFTFDESKTLWTRFEPLDGLLQADEEMFEPSFQSGPIRYYFSDLPDGVDAESFIAGWKNGA